MLELQSKQDDTTLIIDTNDRGDIVFTIKSDRNPVPQYFVMDRGDLGAMHKEIKQHYLDYITHIGGLLD